jgi:hypothetical protein
MGLSPKRREIDKKRPGKRVRSKIIAPRRGLRRRRNPTEARNWLKNKANDEH